MDKYSDPLNVLLLNEYLIKFDETGEIAKNREQVLCGKELTPEYINELKDITKAIQRKWLANSMNT